MTINTGGINTFAGTDLSAYLPLAGGELTGDLTITPTLGIELITDPSLFTDNGNFTYAAGAWTHGGVAYNILTANWTPTIGKWYKIVFETSDASGNWVFQMGGSSFSYITSAGEQTYYVYAVNANAPVWGAYIPFTGNFSAFSVKEMTLGEIDIHNINMTGRIIAESGSANVPTFTFRENLKTGLFCYSRNYLEFTVNGTNMATMAQAGPLFYGFITLGASSDLFLRRDAAASFQLGTDAATPTDQRIKACNGNGTDKAGANFTIGAGQSTGTGAGGKIVLAATPSGSTSSTANAYDGKLEIAPSGIEPTNTGRSLRVWNDFEDFNGVTPPIWYVALTGVGANSSAVGTNLTTGRMGIWRLTCGTTDTGRASIKTNSNAFQMGGGVYTFETEIWISALSDATDTYAIAAGFGDTNAGYVQTDGVYFRYRDTGGGTPTPKWYMCAANGGATTATVTTVDVAATTWTKLKIVVNADCSSAEYFIDGVSVGTVTANLPSTAGNITGAVILLIKDEGTTSRNLDIDWVNLHIALTTSR